MIEKMRFQTSVVIVIFVIVTLGDKIVTSNKTGHESEKTISIPHPVLPSKSSRLINSNSNEVVSTGIPVTSSPYLDSEDCKSLITLNGTYRMFLINHNKDLSTTNDGDELVITCKTEKKNCEFLNSILNMSELFTINTDGKIVRFITHQEEYMGRGEKKFKINVDYASQNNRRIFCQRRQDELTITSNKLTLRINEASVVHIKSSNITAFVKESITLPCTFHSYDKRDTTIEWMRKTDEIDSFYKTVTNGTGNIIRQTKNEDDKTHFSTLTLYHERKWKGIYECVVFDHRYVEIAKSVISINIKEHDKRGMYGAIGAVIGCFVLLTVIIFTFIMKKKAIKRKIETNMKLLNIQQENPMLQNGSDDETFNIYEPLDSDTFSCVLTRLTTRYGHWQSDRSTLVLKQVLGEGNFGSVMLGIMPDCYISGVMSTVAVKTIKGAGISKEQITEFEKEIDVMTTLRHDNIVSLIGLCTETLPMYIIMEYMENGQLNQFLIKQNSKMPGYIPTREDHLTTSDLLFMTIQPCRAIEYLSSKNIVHRDISARNCLVGEHLVVKLADFGLSRGTAKELGKDYYKKDGGMVPVKWMAPEALKFGKYTTANDVWAFGVLMWEIFSLGEVPYHGMSNQEVIGFINSGGRLEMPEMCVEAIWKLAVLCWEEKHENRITISGLSNSLAAEMDCLNRNVIT